jgi:hypothetical protein
LSTTTPATDRVQMPDDRAFLGYVSRFIVSHLAKTLPFPLLWTAPNGPSPDSEALFPI